METSGKTHFALNDEKKISIGYNFIWHDASYGK